MINPANLTNGWTVHVIGSFDMANSLWNFIFLVVDQSVAMQLGRSAMFASSGFILLVILTFTMNFPLYGIAMHHGASRLLSGNGGGVLLPFWKNFVTQEGVWKSWSPALRRTSLSFI